jgi:hypothetical protein
MAVEANKSLDHAKIADARAAAFKTDWRHRIRRDGGGQSRALRRRCALTATISAN